ncbi:MAG: endosialidase [Lachnospiraceae bacterium]|nr:endosialidase [Lachnospiraceae bacterium]
MAVSELLRKEQDGSLSFGNHELNEKAKLEDFKYGGNLMKVKTYKPMTKLEKNGMLAYESVPGTSVYRFNETDKGVSFEVEGDEDAQITVGLQEEVEYEVVVGGVSAGKMKTGMGGKLSFNVELSGTPVEVKIQRD